MDSSPELVQTPGPWRWRQPAGSRTLELVHPRGVLYVLSACRAGMNDATLLFAERTAPDRGGILTKLEVRKGRCSDYLADDELTPDLRLIAEAPTLKARVEELEAKLAELLEGLKALRVNVIRSPRLNDRQTYARLVEDVLDEEIRDLPPTDGIEEWVDLDSMDEAEEVPGV